MRINNADGHVLNHSPALTPRHRELARGIIWWGMRAPGAVVLMVKLDVAGAFTLVWLRPADCGKVSTEIGTEEWGLGPEDVLAALSLTLEFGGCGSPGEWVPWSWGLKEAHSKVYPARPEWHGRECFRSSYPVDDQSLLEAGRGRRLDSGAAHRSPLCSRGTQTRPSHSGSCPRRGCTSSWRRSPRGPRRISCRRTARSPGCSGQRHRESTWSGLGGR